MSITVGKYTFGAWMRKGIGRAVNEADTLGASDGSALERATVRVGVKVNAQEVKKDFALHGPGDLTGVIADAVVRTEPRAGVADFEPNYLPFVEFYEEDLVWRYTPAKAAGSRLRPWLSLVVLEKEEKASNQPGEFTRSKRRVPLPTITVKSIASLPPHGQAWAWGHVHVNDAFDNANDFERFLESLESPDHPNADRIICRLSSCRRLRPNMAYTAFVVPTFETGRLAGLNPKQDLSSVPAQKPGWTGAGGSVELPVYYEWDFRTGEDEDFESLLRKLKPDRADSRVGIRDMDGEKPGWGLTEGTDIGEIVPPPDGPPPTLPIKQTVVGLEGALKAPTSVSRPAKVETTRPFFPQLEGALNFPAKMQSNPATAKLPVVSPPIYGEHHALRHTVETTKEDWLDFLNRDPRQRVPAGFGTRVVQKDQEGYVARAWAQVQKILEANRKIRLVSWAMRVSQALYANLAANFAPEQKVLFFAPLLSKVRGSSTTLAQQMTESTLPPAAVSGAMRRLLRSRGPLSRRAVRGDHGFSHSELVRRMAAGQLTAAPPKPVPGGLATDTDVSEGLPGGKVPGWLRPLLAIGRHWLLLILLLLLAILLVVAIVTGAWALCAAIALLLVIIFLILLALARRLEAVDAIFDPGAAGAAVEETPPKPGFHLTETEPEASSFTPGAGGAGSVEGDDFAHAAGKFNKRLRIRPPQKKPLWPFDLGNADKKLSKGVNPLLVFPIGVSTQVIFPFDPTWLLEPEHLVPAMAYPDFDDPMYEKLRDLSTELLLPNIELIPQNTITLLKTNPPFIESYMVGLNTEFGKELLWREYPTDRRGSYFRQFWDVKGIIATAPQESAAEVSERSKDITPLDTWPSASKLGQHRNPKRGQGEQIVLTVRGELLKKYPNTLIYAQKAHLFHDAHGNPKPSHEPVIGQVATKADIEREIKFPVFHAEVKPDVRFFGFDLKPEQALGAENPQQENDDWGYYFVIQQLPGEPRFGMDKTYEPDDDPATPVTWDDLAWDRFPEGMEFIDVNAGPQSFTPKGPGESLSQWGTDSARMASIFFQKPVMIAIHAREMLKGLV